jgi:hypothetical protein
MKRETAIRVQQSGRAAVTILVAMLEQVENDCSKKEFETIKRGVGLTIGRLQMELLEPLYVQHPDIDDLPKD